MAAQNENLKIEFTGDLSGLSIVVNGKTLYKNKGNGKNDKHPSPAQVRLYKNHSVSSTFASCVNKIPVLKQVWRNTKFKKSPRQSYGKDSEERKSAGKAATFNKIVAANRKIKQDQDYPNESNKFVPDNLEGMPKFDAILLGEELIVNIDFIMNGDRMVFDKSEQSITGAAVFSAYHPKKRSKDKFELFPKWETMKEFISADSCQIILPITIEEQEILKRYNDCYLYFTIATEKRGGKLIRCFNSPGVSSSLADYPLGPVHFTNQPKS